MGVIEKGHATTLNGQERAFKGAVYDTYTEELSKSLPTKKWR